MAIAKTLKNTGKAVKTATKKVAKKVDKAVVEPVAGLFRSDKKGQRKAARAKPSHAKKTKK